MRYPWSGARTHTIIIHLHQQGVTHSHTMLYRTARHTLLHCTALLNFGGGWGSRVYMIRYVIERLELEDGGGAAAAKNKSSRAGGSSHKNSVRSIMDGCGGDAYYREHGIGHPLIMYL